MYIPKNTKGEPKKFLLLVNCDDSARLRTARYIAKQLTELGLETGTLEYGASTGTTYEQVLRAGSYDIYLGQTKLSANYDLSQFFKGWGNLGWGGIADNTLLGMCKEALANSGNYYNLCKMVADDGKIIPVLFGYYEVYAERGPAAGSVPLPGQCILLHPGQNHGKRPSRHAIWLKRSALSCGRCTKR